MDRYHIIHDSEHDTWCVCKDVVRIKCFGSRSDAINLGTEFAQNAIRGQLTIHAQDGAVETVRHY